MKKYKLYIKIATFIAFVIILIAIIFNITQSEKTWIAYYCPSSTNVMYGKTEAKLVEFNSKGKVINSYDTTAYPFSGLVNFDNELIFQTKKGISKVNDDTKEIDMNIKDDTVGYNMAGNLNKDSYYFLGNGSFKDDYYSSKLILGNKDNQYIHELKGFINSYGNDESNIYLITDGMNNKDNKQIQKISIDGIENISTTSSNIPYNLESNFKMIVTDNYIYAFVLKDENKISILKISKESLEIENTIDLITFNYESSGDSYYPISTNAIFLKDNKIYYPTLCGKVYTFDIDKDEFNEEFTLDNYIMTSSLNAICNYDYENEEIYVLYLNSSDKKYYLNNYDINGKLKDTINIKVSNMDRNMYPHNFTIKKN